MLEKNQIIYRNSEILVNEVDGETVMMSIENGTYYGMNPTGNYIWNLLQEESSIEELLLKLSNTYNLSEDQCQKEVLPFVQTMIDEKILLKKD
jgi:hypothetical protein